MISYDELYGISLGDYCKAHETTLDELIQKIEIDIQILEANLEKVLNNDSTNYLVDQIFFTIKKKRDHVERLKEWKQETGISLE